jgi:hypothetical protein
MSVDMDLREEGAPLWAAFLPATASIKSSSESDSYFLVAAAFLAAFFDCTFFKSARDLAAASRWVLRWAGVTRPPLERR